MKVSNTTFSLKARKRSDWLITDVLFGGNKAENRSVEYRHFE